MERKPAEITIQNIQHDISEEAQTNIYTGFYAFHNGCHMVTYEEHQKDADSSQNTKCLLKLTEQTVHITKKGLVSTKMHFESGVCFQDDYRTPCGIFAMVIDTHYISIKTGADNLYAELNYHLHLNQAPVSLCTVKITIRF